MMMSLLFNNIITLFYFCQQLSKWNKLKINRKLSKEQGIVHVSGKLSFFFTFGKTCVSFYQHVTEKQTRIQFFFFSWHSKITGIFIIHRRFSAIVLLLLYT